MSRLGWYLKRIRVMGAREIVHRIGQQVSLQWLRVQYTLGFGLARQQTSNVAYAFCTGTERRLPDLPVDRAALQTAYSALIDGSISIADVPWSWKNDADVWHRAPDTGKTWPRRFFAGIAYREGNPIGDIRQLWEPSRLQHLLNAALAAGTQDADSHKLAVRVVTRQLQSWVRENPPLEGPHYISAMECALRLIAVCHTCDLLREHFDSDVAWRALTAIVESHVPLIERRISAHSSAGNHTIAEAAGLVYASLLFPEMPGSRRRTDRGIRLLAKAAANQVLPDGGGVEQAVWYHRFNIQLLWLAETLLRRYGEEVPKAMSEAVERGSRFLRTMGLNAGWLPPIGDSDGGYALSRFLAVPRPDDGVLSDPVTFPESGYTVAIIANEPEARLIFDHGRLGMAPSYGHAHADALNVLLRFGDLDLFVDPGTYGYTGDQQWRAYFRSTTAHNTVTVDGSDQAKQEACFMWSRPFTARLLAEVTDNGAGGRLLAEHDGYRTLGIRHVRGVAWQTNEWLFVWDHLLGPGEHTLDLHWHLPIEPVTVENEQLRIESAEADIIVQLHGGELSIHRGQQKPILGWRSPRYGTREPITTVRMRYSGSLPHSYTTIIRFTSADARIEEAQEWMKSKI